MTTQLVTPKGYATPQANVVISDQPPCHRKQIIWPYYAWCGEHDGHLIDMVPVEERMAGCMSTSTVIEIFIDGQFAARIGVDGDAARIADYLRGGHYDRIDRDLAEHSEIENGKTARLPAPQAPSQLLNIIKRVV